eukprot:5172706-Prymnesium_polylepis.2
MCVLGGARVAHQPSVRCATRNGLGRPLQMPEPGGEGRGVVWRAPRRAARGLGWPSRRSAACVLNTAAMRVIVSKPTKPSTSCRSNAPSSRYT